VIKHQQNTFSVWCFSR